MTPEAEGGVRSPGTVRASRSGEPAVESPQSALSGAVRPGGSSRPERRRDRARGRARNRRAAAENRAGYAFLLPWLAGFIAFTVGPIVAIFVLSFTKYTLLRPPQWVGLANYHQLMSDPNYRASVTVTGTYVLVAVPATLAAALAVAVLLNNRRRGMSAYRAIFYLPSLMGGSVAMTLVWRKFFGAGGGLDQILGSLGVHNAQAVSLVDSVQWALYALVLLAVWQFGAPMVVFLAGLRRIPRSMYEAASLDGAGQWQQFRKITLPLLTPVIFFNLVLGIVGAFQTFTNAYVISGGMGGPVNSTLFYALYIYQSAFERLEMGYASAMAWLLLLVTGLCTGLLFWSQRFWVEYGEVQ
jgi:multiple sugar transport system permease protein